MKKSRTFIDGKKRRGVNRYVDENFAKLLDEIKQTRLVLGKDTFQSVKSDWRLTLAMVRHPQFIKIKEDLINAELS